MSWMSQALQDFPPLLVARTVEGMNGGVVGIVVGRFVVQGDLQSPADILVVLRATQYKVQILKNVHPSKKN